MATWVGFSSVNDEKKSCKIYDIELIKQDILNQFMCPKGSRYRMPEWGSIIWNVLYDQFTEALLEDIENDCRRIVESDSRVELSNVFMDKSDHMLMVTLDLVYVPTNQNFDMYVSYNTNLTENQ